MKTTLRKPVAFAIGAAIASTLAVTTVAQAGTFSATDLGQGYTQLASDDTAGEKGKEGKCGEGKCGEGKCGADKKGDEKGKEGKCGEGKCGEGKCGGDKKNG